MKRSLILLLPLLTVCLFSRLHAQSLPKRIYIDHHSIPGVIRSSYVASMVQDEYGLLWIGSSSGLYRFDGNHFTGYKYESSDGVTLDNRQIISLLWDSVAHRLLIGTRMAGLLQFDYESNKISLITEKEPTVN
jgi:ligand-binding sensor domain-containing protein